MKTLLDSGQPYRILAGDVRACLRSLPAESVHCCVTSPPYWGLRAYGTEPQVWGGDAQGCEHEWVTETLPARMLRWGDDTTLSEKQSSTAGATGLVRKGGNQTQGATSCRSGRRNVEAQVQTGMSQGQFCQHCGAWRGELGSEPSPALFVAHMVEVFAEVRRVLRKDGTCWVNLGDSYASSVNGNPAESYRETDDRTFRDKPFSTVVAGLKPKDLVGMPWRVALALQEDGWWLRSDIIWAKSNPMPSSVEDRPTTSHEYLFLLAKAARYYYDGDAIREPYSEGSIDRYKYRLQNTSPGCHRPEARDDALEIRTASAKVHGPNPSGRNRRTVWTINTESFSGAHFATFPTKLVEPCLLAGTSERGCCPHCGAGWERVVEREFQPQSDVSPERCVRGIAKPEYYDSRQGTPRGVTAHSTTGWRPTCRCPHTEDDLIPATVLDPFSGSGTTCAVAVKHGRWGIGCELNPEYIKLAHQRIAPEIGLFSVPQDAPAPVAPAPPPLPEPDALNLTEASTTYWELTRRRDTHRRTGQGAPLTDHEEQHRTALYTRIHCAEGRRA